MNKTIKAFSILILSFLLFCVTSEIVLRNIPNDYRQKANYLKKNGKQINTLILGSSHTFYGLNPNLFTDKAYNVAHSSQTVDLDYEIFNQYKKFLPNLKTIIIPISYFIYTSELEDFNKKKIKNYTIYWNLPIESYQPNYYFEVLNFTPKENYKRINDYYFEHKNPIIIDSLGYIKKRFEPKWDEKQKALKSFRQHSANLNSEEVQSKIQKHFAQLESMINWAEKHNIKVILISTPTTKTYKNLVIQTPQYSNLVKNTTLLAKHKNVIWADYFKNDQDFILEDFKDADHLSSLGANKLTYKINQIISTFQ